MTVPVAFVDRLGYLRCAECSIGTPLRARPLSAVYADAAPHNTEACDICRRPVSAAVQP